MAEETNTPVPEEKSRPDVENEESGKSTIVYRAGKYFLILAILAAQLVGAWYLVDNYYEPMQAWIQNARDGEPVFYQMDQMVVNPANTNGQRYLMVEISLELENNRALERLEQQKYRLRHTINEALTSRTVEQLVQAEERERMRSEMTNLINELTGPGSVRNLYYSKYVMQ
ncbi:MAG: flagellar basal body-associated FliL family protein [Balneolaceae bacterium]